MSGIFLKLLNMSITAGWLILAVIGIRLIFRKIPKWVNCLLWGIVAVRLICPFSIESPFSMQPSTEPIKSSAMVEGEVHNYIPSIDSNLPIVEYTINPMLTETFAYDESESTAPLQVLTDAADHIWLCGLILAVTYVMGSMIRLRRLVREAVRVRENIYICDAVKSPFILGMIRPRIYLSSSLSGKDMNYIIAHEAAHLKRKDHWWKPLGYSLLCIYWFNPLCWAAYIMLCKDIELACDEKLAKNMTFLEKKEYSEVLLSYAQQRRIVIACPLAFGEVGVKRRVKSVLKYQKPKLYIMIASIAVCVVTAVCFLTNPLNKVNAETVFSKGGHEKDQPPENDSIQESPLGDTENTTDSKVYTTDQWTENGVTGKIYYALDNPDYQTFWASTDAKRRLGYISVTIQLESAETNAFIDDYYSYAHNWDYLDVPANVNYGQTVGVRVKSTHETGNSENDIKTSFGRVKVYIP